MPFAPLTTHTIKHASPTTPRQSSVCGSSAIGAHMMQRRHSSLVHRYSFIDRIARAASPSACGAEFPFADGISCRFLCAPMSPSPSRRCWFLAGVLLLSCTGDVTRCTGRCTRRRQDRYEPAANPHRRALPQTARLFADRQFHRRRK